MLKCKLTDIADVVDCEHKTAPTVSNSEYYSIRTTDILGGKIDFQKANRVSYETYLGWTKRALPEVGDLIFAREAPVGEIGWIKDGYKVCLGQRTVLIKVRSNQVDSRFLLYYFVNPSTKSQLQEQSGGSVVSHLNMKDIRNFDLSIPPLEEQKTIASVLSSLDDKIDLLHRQNTTLERIAETLFRQWFVEEAKDDWKLGILKDEFDFTMGQSPSGTSFNEERIGVPMFQGNADFGFRFPTERVYTTEPSRFAEPMDTLISVRAPVGAQNMAKVKCCIGRGVAAFRYKLNPNFYTYTYFKLRSLMEEIKQFNDEGTVFGSISKSDFENLTASIPNDKDVIGFEAEVKPINDKIINNCQQILTLEKLRDSLLPKLMSGEIKLELRGANELYI